MRHELVATADRPDLVETTARWRWKAFFRADGVSLDEVLDRERQAAGAARLMPRTLVLLADGEPIGMASLAAQDLLERPDLTPWLAGVFVVERARGQRHAGRLVAGIEAVARDASIPTLWLYTRTAERIYARIGWARVQTFERDARLYALMRRDLAS